MPFVEITISLHRIPCLECRVDQLCRYTIPIQITWKANSFKVSSKCNENDCQLSSSRAYLYHANLSLQCLQIFFEVETEIKMQKVLYSRKLTSGINFCYNRWNKISANLTISELIFSYWYEIGFRIFWFLFPRIKTTAISSWLKTSRYFFSDRDTNLIHRSFIIIINSEFAQMKLVHKFNKNLQS